VGPQDDLFPGGATGSDTEEGDYEDDLSSRTRKSRFFFFSAEIPLFFPFLPVGGAHVGYQRILHFCVVAPPEGGNKLFLCFVDDIFTIII